MYRICIDLTDMKLDPVFYPTLKMHNRSCSYNIIRALLREIVNGLKRVSWEQLPPVIENLVTAGAIHANELDYVLVRGRMLHRAQKKHFGWRNKTLRNVYLTYIHDVIKCRVTKLLNLQCNRAVYEGYAFIAYIIQQCLVPCSVQFQNHMRGMFHHLVDQFDIQHEDHESIHMLLQEPGSPQGPPGPWPARCGHVQREHIVTLNPILAAGRHGRLPVICLNQ